MSFLVSQRQGTGMVICLASAGISARAMENTYKILPIWPVGILTVELRWLNSKEEHPVRGLGDFIIYSQKPYSIVSAVITGLPIFKGERTGTPLCNGGVATSRCKGACGLGSIGAFFGNLSLPQGWMFVLVWVSVITCVIIQLTLEQYGFNCVGPLTCGFSFQ